MTLWVDLTLDDKPFPGALGRWLVEARVEMELSKPTRFALRFEDDVCDGKYEIVGSNKLTGDSLKQGATIGVFVALDGPPDNGRQCLVRGPITKLRAASTIGGTGSWTEAHGEDRRITMSRNGIDDSYAGLASDTAEKILNLYGFQETDIQPTLIQYDKKNHKLSQHGDDLSFLEGLARANNMEFWVDYKVSGATVTETARFKTSPHRDTAVAPTPATLPQLPVLTATDKRVLSVQPPQGQCANVTRFETHVDFEKPTDIQAFTISADGKKSVVTQSGQNKDGLDPNRQPPAFDDKRKKLEPQAPGDPQEAYLTVEGLALEQSWFVQVDCSSTLELLKFAVRPHQILTVQNAGKVLSGLYQVTKATYVINAADQFIDFTIRANGLGAA
jgi:hypothetical protein